MWLLFACLPSPPVSFEPVDPPDGYALHGIDVSGHQGWVDWPAVAASGDVDFVYLKATEGRSHVDRRFASNLEAVQDAGLPVGAYHFWSACRTADEQADHFLATATPTFLRPVLDVEYDGRCNRPGRMGDLAAETHRFLDRVEAAWGTRPLLYSNDSFLRNEARGVRADRWAAAYSRPPRSAWIVWQHTDRGAVDGIRGPVDRNVARGTTLDALSRLPEQARESPVESP